MHTLDRDPLWVRVLLPVTAALWLIWAWFVMAILWLIDRADDRRQRRHSPYRRRWLSWWAKRSIEFVGMLIFLASMIVLMGAQP